MEKSLVLLILLSPLLGFLINGFRWRSEKTFLSGVIGSSAVAVSFVSAVFLFFFRSQESLKVHFFNWIEVGNFLSSVSFLVDPVSLSLTLVITGVGTLIHIFSMGYMSHDKRPSKYFAYLNFFVFNMLILVLADNLLLMFVGWEGVGLCSYLLISFWFTDSQKAQAGLKAFITNRIGDAGFLLGIFIIFLHFQSVDFLQISSLITSSEGEMNVPITLACLFLFIGAMGKSAQIPLYVWLPDAMAGPTPVSALIHAATMVTAGIYMIVRLHVLFLASPVMMNVIAVTGVLTALLGATIGLTQWDIKKVLAYSTISQLGFMFLALGVGAFSSAMFHLITHAFFKALMFLGAGSVIHSLGGEQDLRKMGGLKKYMPITHITFVAGWLAIMGIFPFSGFFSKDEILWKTFSTGHYFLWFLGFIASLLTAFYMTRLMTLTFWTSSQYKMTKPPHESPASMTIPLVVLGVLSVVAGVIGLPHIFPGHPPHLLQEALNLKDVASTITSVSAEVILMVLSVGLAGASSYTAYWFYKKRPEIPMQISKKFFVVYKLILDKYRVDEFYKKSILDPLWNISQSLWSIVDVNFIDKAPYYISQVTLTMSKNIRTLQNGRIERYAVYIIFGIVVFVSWTLIR